MLKTLTVAARHSSSSTIAWREHCSLSKPCQFSSGEIYASWVSVSFEGDEQWLIGASSARLLKLLEPTQTVFMLLAGFSVTVDTGHTEWLFIIFIFGAFCSQLNPTRSRWRHDAQILDCFPKLRMISFLVMQLNVNTSQLRLVSMSIEHIWQTEAE